MSLANEAARLIDVVVSLADEAARLAIVVAQSNYAQLCLANGSDSSR